MQKSAIAAHPLPKVCDHGAECAVWGESRHSRHLSGLSTRFRPAAQRQELSTRRVGHINQNLVQRADEEIKVSTIACFVTQDLRKTMTGMGRVAYKLLSN